MLRITFDEAIRRAIEKNPTVQAAAAGILRAEGLLRQARAATRLQVFGNITTTTLNTGVDFQGTTVTPRNSLAATLTADMPIVAAAAWARRAQAEDTKSVAELTVADTKRQVAFAAADAYLTIIAQRRGRFAGVVELRLLDAARGAVEHVRLHFRGPRGRKLAVGEVEEQVLGLGAVHALPSRTPGGGSGSASSAVTPSSASALRSPRRA